MSCLVFADANQQHEIEQREARQCTNGKPEGTSHRQDYTPGRAGG
jgi:hypothetical protein